MEPDTKDITALTLRIETSLYRRIRIAAAKEGTSATQWMREALEIVVNHEEAKDA